LNGMMQRVTLKGREPWADASIADLLSSLRREKTDLDYLILSSTQKAPYIEVALAAEDLEVKKTGNKNWVWFRVTHNAE
jgi:hypothetical protein